jgi:hypothetical protein
MARKNAPSTIDNPIQVEVVKSAIKHRVNVVLREQLETHRRVQQQNAGDVILRLRIPPEPDV